MRTLLLITALGCVLIATAQNDDKSTPDAFTPGVWNNGQFEQRTLGPIAIFPNPASDQASVSFPGLTGQVVVSILDGSGRVMRMDQVNQVAGQQYLLDVDDLPDGVYLLNVEQDEQRITERFVVAH